MKVGKGEEMIASSFYCLLHYTTQQFLTLVARRSVREIGKSLRIKIKRYIEENDASQMNSALNLIFALNKNDGVKDDADVDEAVLKLLEGGVLKVRVFMKQAALGVYRSLDSSLRSSLRSLGTR